MNIENEKKTEEKEIHITPLGQMLCEIWNLQTCVNIVSFLVILLQVIQITILLVKL